MATLDSNKVTGVSVVSNASDAANKTYVDNYISGLGSPTIPSLENSAGSFLSVTSNTPGVYWYARTVGSPYNINAVASGNGYYVAGDSAGIALYSTDTISWTRSNSSGFGSSAISSLAYYNGYFVAGGDNTVQNWNSLNTFASGFPSTADVRCATYGSSGFVIGGEGESVIWTLRTTPFAANAIYTSLYKNLDVTTVGVSTTFVSSGLVVHLDSRNSSSYPGSGVTWYDLSGNGNNMTLSGTTYYADGIYFNGSGDFGTISNNILTTGSSIPHTIDLWVNFTATETDPNRWWLGVLGQYGIGASLLIGTSINQTQFGRWSAGNDPIPGSVAPILRGINVWMNIVITYDGSVYKSYINGDLDSSAVLSLPINLTNTNFTLAKPPIGESYFNGKVSVVKIYNRELSSSEVSQNYNSYSPVTNNPLYYISGAAGFLALSTDSVVWTLRTSGTAVQIGYATGGRGFIYAPGQTNSYVYAGASGVLATSTDSIVWTQRTSASAAIANQAIIYGVATYLRSNATAGNIAASTNAIIWTLRTTGNTTNIIQSLLYTTYAMASDYYACYLNCRAAGVIQASTDTIVWTSRTSGTAAALYQLLYADIYMVSGASGVLNTSTDAIVWTLRTSGTAQALYGLAYTSGSYVASGAAGTTLYSTDAITWRLRTSGFGANVIQTSTFGNGIFINGGVGATLTTTTASTLATGGFGARIANSTNGINWTLRTTPSNLETVTLIDSNDTSYTASCVNYDGEFAGIIQSTDTINWVLRTSGFSVRTAKALACTNYSYVLGGDNGNNTAAQWTLRTSGFGANAIYSLYLTWLGSFWAGGAGGLLSYSSDGVTWELRTSGTTAQIGSATGGIGIIGYGDWNSIMYAGASGVLAVSTDSYTWQLRTAAAGATAINSIYSDGNIYVRATATPGNLAVSTDTISWSLRTTGNTTNIINYFNNNASGYGSYEYFYYNCGAAGRFQVSTDCIVWISRTSGTTQAINSADFIPYVGWILCGASGTIRYSTDSIVWESRTSGITAALYGIKGFYIGMFVGVVAYGASGAFITSTDTINWSVRTTGFGTNAVQSAVALSQTPLGYTISGSAGFLATSNSDLIRDGLNIPLVTSSDGIVWVNDQGPNPSNSVTAFKKITDPNDPNPYIIVGVFTDLSLKSKLQFLFPNYGYYYPGWAFSNQVISGTGLTINDVLSNGILNMVSGNSGLLQTSTDGFVWTLRTTGETTNLTTLSYTPKGTYLLGTSGGIVRSSTDGITWISRTSGTTNAINQFANSSSTYIAAALSGTLLYGNSDTLSYLGNGGLVSVSTNGIQWSLRTTCADIQSATNIGVGGGYYLASGTNYLAQPVLIASTDTINWVIRTTPFGTNIINDLEIPSFNSYLATGNAGLFATSTDSFVWTLRTSAFGVNAINTITHNLKNLFVVAGASGILNTSTNGIQWILRTSGFGTSSINDLTYDYNGNYYIAASAGGAIRTSTDAITWSSRSSPTTNQLNTISNFNDYYLIGGNTSTLLATSTDTTQIKWNLQPFATKSSLNIVTDGLVLHLDAGNILSYSGSGTTWNDLSGIENTGTLVNGPTYSTLNQGNFIFDGVDDYVTLGTPFVLNQIQLPLTITCWANLTTSSGLATLYGAYKNITPAGTIYSLFRVDDGVLKYYSSADSNDTGGFNYQYQGTFTVPLNTWNFYAVVVSGTLTSPNVRIYLNNSYEEFSYSKFYTPVDSTIDFRVGGNQSVLTEGWKGKLSTIQVYTRSLSPTEIQKNYNAFSSRYNV